MRRPSWKVRAYPSADQADGLGGRGDHGDIEGHGGISRNNLMEDRRRPRGSDHHTKQFGC